MKVSQMTWKVPKMALTVRKKALNSSVTVVLVSQVLVQSPSCILFLLSLYANRHWHCLLCHPSLLHDVPVSFLCYAQHTQGELLPMSTQGFALPGSNSCFCCCCLLRSRAAHSFLVVAATAPTEPSHVTACYCQASPSSPRQ